MIQGQHVVESLDDDDAMLGDQLPEFRMLLEPAAVLAIEFCAALKAGGKFVLHRSFLRITLLCRQGLECPQFFVVLGIAADEDFRNQTQGKLNSETRGTLIYANLR
jgi:hypothetical protein